jgi:hypothetical protein
LWSPRAELWAAGQLASAASACLRRLEGVSPGHLASVRVAAGALVEAMVPVIANRDLVEHVIGVAPHMLDA